jgi:hypothetical protein
MSCVRWPSVVHMLGGMWQGSASTGWLGGGCGLVGQGYVGEWRAPFQKYRYRLTGTDGQLPSTASHTTADRSTSQTQQRNQLTVLPGRQHLLAQLAAPPRRRLHRAAGLGVPLGAAAAQQLLQRLGLVVVHAGQGAGGEDLVASLQAGMVRVWIHFPSARAARNYSANCQRASKQHRAAAPINHETSRRRRRRTCSPTRGVPLLATIRRVYTPGVTMSRPAR